MLVALGLIVLTLGAFGHVVANGFVNFDDFEYVARNRQVKAGLSGDGVVWAFTTTRTANWHPLTWLSLELDATLFGGEAAWGFHLTNLLLHAANVVLLFVVLRWMTGLLWRSAVVAALFAVHPLHVESVAWIAERKDVLCALFGMLTLLAYAWYVERPGWGRYALVAAAFTLGLLAKPMLVTWPCVLLLLDYWPLGRLKSEIRKPKSETNPNAEAQNLKRRCELFGSFGFRILEKVPLFAITGAVCLVTVYAQHKGGAVNSLEQVPLGERMMNSLVAYAGYLGQLLWPAGLAPFYPHPHGRLLLEQAARAGLVLALISGLAFWLRRRRYLTVGWLWFLGTLVPVIGLVQVGSQAMADRYMYLPSIGLLIALTWGAADLVARRSAAIRPVIALVALLLGVWVPIVLWRRFGAAATVMEDGMIYWPLAGLTAGALLGWWAGGWFGLWPARLSLLAPAVAVLVGLCVALSAWQVRLWHNSIWLWEYTLGVTEDNPLAHNNLGDAYWNSRHHEHVERARANFTKAKDLMPRHAGAWNNLGLVALDQGQVEEAERDFREAYAIDPGLAVISLNWGMVLAREGRFEEAIPHYQEAIRRDPGAAPGPSQMGRALAALDRWEDAVGAFQRALTLEPRDKDYRADRAWALEHLGHTQEAAQDYAAVVADDAAWPEETRRAAWTLATDANPGRRSGAEAVRRAEEAVHAQGGDDPRFLDTLAAAYAEAGCFPLAASTARQALSRAGGDALFREEVQRRLAGYQNGLPYRQEPP